MKCAVMIAGSIFILSANTAWAKEQTVTMDIQNMTCALCPITVSKAIGGVEGVNAVNVNLDDHSAQVTFEDTVTKIAIIARASSNAGYPAQQRSAK